MLVISLKSYDQNLLNQFCEKIRKQPGFGKIGGSNLQGPIFLPKKKKLYTVIRSSHVYSLSREQFEVCVHRRAFTISDNRFIEHGKKLNLKIKPKNLVFDLWDAYRKENFLIISKKRYDNTKGLRFKKRLFLFWKNFLRIIPVGIGIKLSYQDSSKFFGV